MYSIKKGLLNEDGKPIFALGQSYYPSFNPTKFPVMPDQDRIGEMKKDLRGMRDMGFNHVRFAALGEVTLEDGKIKVDTPFIDAMIEEAGRLGLSVSVRLHGFTVNLRGFTDADMINWNGKKYGEEDPVKWSDFVRTTLYHDGINEDNENYSKALAEHYKKYPNVVGFQIYNEPHYPTGGAYDYRQKTIGEYRKWAVEKGVLTEGEARDYEPPRGRDEKSPEEWAYWRLFSLEALTKFLNNCSDATKKAAPEQATFTCFTTASLSRVAALRCADYFANANAMDILGYTCYLRAKGADYYPLCMAADTMVSAAKLGGRESWCIELDSRTYIPTSVFNRNTYTSLGAGLKGIVYYQWRGDCPVPGVPFPNSCGILNYDGTKTANFDNAAKAVSFINKMSDTLMQVDRVHDGVGLLHSDFATFMADARENPAKMNFGADLKNSYLVEYTATYRDLHDGRYNVDVVRAEHLKDNTFGIKVLFVPRYNDLSKEEKAAVDLFRENGGTVYCNTYTYMMTMGLGYKKLGTTYYRYEDSVYDLALTPAEACEVSGIKPMVHCDENTVGVQMLAGGGKTLIFLTNKSAARETNSCRLRLNFEYNRATIHTFDGEGTLSVSGKEIAVENFTDGAIVEIEYR